MRDPGKGAAVLGPQAELSTGNILQSATILKAITPEIDTFINLVGILMESRSASFSRIHVEGVYNVIDACRKMGIKRLIHISALGTRDNARSLYHRTKREAELLIARSDLDYTIFRPSVIFGKEDAFTNPLARAIRISPFIAVPGSGRNLMQTVFVKDVVKALSMSIGMDGAKGKIYEVGGPERLTFDSIIDKIAAALGKGVRKVHVPISFMRLGAGVAEVFLPKPPITRDALLMLEEDNVTDRNALPEVFGIRPTLFSDGIRTYLPG